MKEHVERIRQQLADRNLKVVAKNAGLHSNTLYRFVKSSNVPSLETVEKLEKYLKASGNAA